MTGPETDRTPAGRQSTLSRRRLLNAIGAGLAFGSAALLRSVPAAAKSKQEKMSQKTAHYRGSPMEGRNCAHCKYFVAPKACRIVSGTISPKGWCLYWTKPRTI